MKKVLVALSGGVDSAVAAGLLLEQGYEAAGAMMALHPGAAREAGDAAAAAKRLGISFRLFHWEEDFQRLVVEPFARVYREGGTPNPCVCCNRALKFGKFLDAALELGFDAIATGHYARLTNDGGRALLKTALDAGRDQSYMLAGLSQRQLSHTLLPLGTLTKTEVRARAAAFGLAEQQGKKDSQDICFVPDGDYLGYLAAHGYPPQPGLFLRADGAPLGPHRGYEGYTIGQRRGLGVAAGRRLYVVAKPRPDVVLGEKEALYRREVRLTGMNWILRPRTRPGGTFRAEAKLRYTARPASCTAAVSEDGARLLFDEAQRAVTPGQAAVLYDGETVLGMGTIAPEETKNS